VESRLVSSKRRLVGLAVERALEGFEERQRRRERMRREEQRRSRERKFPLMPVVFKGDHGA
jgi:hypothetical protein